MRKELLIAALGLYLIASRSGAEALAMPGDAPTFKATLPGKGTSMADVEKKFGEPAAKRPTVGGDTPKHPPITRWDYPGFSVIFEKDKVIDAVIPGAPPAIYHQEQLQSTAGGSAPPMPGPAVPTEATPAPMEAPPAEAPPETASPTSEPQTSAPVATPENPNPDRPSPPK